VAILKEQLKTFENQALNIKTELQQFKLNAT